MFLASDVLLWLLFWVIHLLVVYNDGYITGFLMIAIFDFAKEIYYLMSGNLLFVYCILLYPASLVYVAPAFIIEAHSA